MKRKTLLTALTVMAIILFGCNGQMTDDKQNNNDKIAVKVCRETSPVWLINEINSIIQPVKPNYRPVSVYSIILNDVTYILLTDMVNDAATYALRFFLCSGESVPFETERYNMLQQTYNENREKFTLLWSNSNN